MKKELNENEMKTNLEHLAELLKEYELAKLGHDVQRQCFADIHNLVLAENIFVSDFDCDEIKKGDRITDANYDFLMREEDYKRYLELSTPYAFEQGLIDEQGRYTQNWLVMEVDSRLKLVNYFIDNIIPDPMRKGFEYARTNVVYQDKLIDMIKKTFI